MGATGYEKNPKNFTTDNTDNTDSHGSKEFNRPIFEFANPCHPLLSVVRFVFCAKQVRPSLD
jgi:hypothetical protein